MSSFESYCTTAILLLGVFSIIHSFYLPVMGPRALSPALFPLVIGILLAALSALQLVLDILRKRKNQNNFGNFSQEKNNKIQHTSDKKKEERNLFIIVIILLLYMYLLPLIHFVPSTLLFLILLMTYINNKISLKIIIISVIITVSIYYSFSSIFKLILP